MPAKRSRRVALGIGLAWACFWVFFETAEALGSRHFGQAIVFVVAMFGPAAVAFRWPSVGGGMFLAAGVAAIAMFVPAWTRHFDIAQFLLLFTIMPLPPLAAGALLLIARKRPPAAA